MSEPQEQSQPHRYDVPNVNGNDADAHAFAHAIAAAVGMGWNIKIKVNDVDERGVPIEKIVTPAQLVNDYIGATRELTNAVTNLLIAIDGENGEEDEVIGGLTGAIEENTDVAKKALKLAKR